MRKDDYLEEWADVIAQLSKSVSEAQTTEISERDIFNFLLIKYGHEPDFEFATDIYIIKPDYQRLLKELIVYNFDCNRIEVETSSGDVHYSQLMRYKAAIKSSGIIWVLHKYDKDPFPSLPHAHNFDNNFKLHLGTGQIFKRTQQVGTLPKKELIDVRDKFTKRGFVMPPSDAK